MKNNFKRWTSILLLAVFFLGIGNIKSVKAVTSNNSSQVSGISAQSTEEVKTFATKEEAAKYMREEMVKRNNTISFSIKTAYVKTLPKEVANLAMSYDDSYSSSEGDYLKANYQGWKCSVKYNKTKVITTLTFTVNYLTTYNQELEVDKEVKNVLNQLNVYNSDDYTKIKAVHDYIANNIEYDKDLDKHSAYNAIIEKKSVCQGIVLLTYKMLKELNVGVRCVYGNSNIHGWNIVCLDGKWYNIDNSWDQNITGETGEVSYKFFLKNDNDFAEHVRNAQYDSDEFRSAYPISDKSYVHVEETADKNGIAYNGQLSVKNADLVNSKGEKFALKGMSSHGMQWYSSFCTEGALKTTKDYGANVFRIAMYTDENGYIANPSIKYQVYDVIDRALKLDMYVIVDWHVLNDQDPLRYKTQSKEFFKEVSKKYANNPGVIYEICNEPNGYATWENHIKPYAEEVIPVIRANSPNALVLVGTPTWSQDVDRAADNQLNFKNVMYSCHFYAGTHGQFLRDKIDYARSKNAAIFISEFGTTTADGNGGVYEYQTQEWLNFLNERKMSYVNWSLCDKGEGSAALKPGASKDGNWSDNDLSTSGKLIFNSFSK